MKAAAISGIFVAALLLTGRPVFAFTLLVTDLTENQSIVQLAQPVEPGAIFLVEPDPFSPFKISDKIVFPENPATPGLATTVQFFSDVNDDALGTVPDPADTGLPTDTDLATFLLNETTDPVIYVARPGLQTVPGHPSEFLPDPGGLPSGSNNLAYRIHSDVEAVPLPSAVWGGLAIISGVGAWRKLHRPTDYHSHRI